MLEMLTEPALRRNDVEALQSYGPQKIAGEWSDAWLGHTGR